MTILSKKEKILKVTNYYKSGKILKSQKLYVILVMFAPTVKIKERNNNEYEKKG